MSMEMIVVRLNALVFLLYGIGFLVLPEALSRFVTDTVPRTVSGIVDMRATYGGMSVAVGVMLLVLASGYETVRKGLVGVLLLMLSMAGGRILGMLVDGAGNPVMGGYLVLEIVMAVIAFWLLIRTPRQAG